MANEDLSSPRLIRQDVPEVMVVELGQEGQAFISGY
jgi:hypothetical protein